MNNFDLIDAYLDNDMNPEELQRFEQQLSSNAELKRELGFQQELIVGIQQARRLELKARLDNVAVGGNSVGQSLTLSKVITGIIILGLVGWGIYSLYDNETSQDFMPVADANQETVEELIEDQSENIPVTEEASPNAESDTPEDAEASMNTEANEKPQLKSEESVPEVREVIKPDIKKPEMITGFDGAEEIADSLQAPGTVASGKKESNLSTIDVAIDNTRKKYTFHYQFKGGKLFLYGDFSSGLYEILEFNPRNDKTLFLYFQNNYYSLDNKQDKIVRLESVKDRSLIMKLKEARGMN